MQKNKKRVEPECILENAPSTLNVSGNLRHLFYFFRFISAASRLQPSSFYYYAAVGTRQSVPDFEVRCSSLSAHLVSESPAGETYSAAWQPETVGRRKGGGRKAVIFFFFSSSLPECIFFLPPQKPTRKPERTVCGRVAEKRAPLWIIRAFLCSLWIFFFFFLFFKASCVRGEKWRIDGKLHELLKLPPPLPPPPLEFPLMSPLK